MKQIYLSRNPSIDWGDNRIVVRLARLIDRWEGKLARKSLFGYEEGNLKPWWSPSVALWRISDRINNRSMFP